MTFSKTLILVGAYNRTYSSEEAVVTDWLGGKDFRIVSGPYCSIRDLEELKSKFNTIVISYDYGRKTYVVKC